MINTLVQGNYIGTDVSGTQNVGNVGDGIQTAAPIVIGGVDDDAWHRSRKRYQRQR